MDVEVAVKDVSIRFGSTIALDNVSAQWVGGTVQGIVGHNGAGKTTLVKVLSGQVRPDGGRVMINGAHYNYLTPGEAADLGIGVVNQETTLCLHLTVLQNLFLGRERARLGMLDWGLMARQGEALLAALELDHVKNVRVGELDVMHKQLAEVARALLLNPRILILDEPNSAFGKAEAAALFVRVRRLRDRGHLIVYISHRLREVKEIADNITVLRNGRIVGSVPPDVTIPQLAYLMLGEIAADAGGSESGPRETRALHAPDTIALESWTSTRGKFRDIDLKLRAGEIVGVTGIEGAGHREMIRSLFGLHPANGRYRVGGREMMARAPQRLLEQGVAYLSPDRALEGLLPGLSVEKNIGASAEKYWSRWGFQQSSRLRAIAVPLMRRWGVRGSPDRDVQMLSGGNQQKSMLARLLASRPRVLILEEPTRGVDIGAKAEIYRVLNDLSAAGSSILIGSPEFDELVTICHRVVVLREGRIIAELAGTQLTEDALLQLSA